MPEILFNDKVKNILYCKICQISFSCFVLSSPDSTVLIHDGCEMSQNFDC